jgi:hypothetical protein
LWLERDSLFEDHALTFSIKKTYYNRSIDFFAPVVWRLLSDPNLNGSIYTAALGMQVRVVQHIDSSNIVLLNGTSRPVTTASRSK